MWRCLAELLPRLATWPAARQRAAWQRRCAALAPDARAQADVWLLEWHWLHAHSLAWLPAWPAAPRLRARYLTACAHLHRTPPRRAWRWLAGMSPAAPLPARACWIKFWRAFVAGAGAGRRRTRWCLLNGTPYATLRTIVVLDWHAAAVRAYFLNGWQQAQRTGRERSSRIEERWWRRVRAAFPAQRPQRHVPLPACGMHLDLYWRAPQVALEIQGEPHWQACGYYGGAAGLARRQERDARKRALCTALGITLIEVTRDTPAPRVLKRLAALLG